MTAKSRSALNTQADNDLPDNTSGQIAPTHVRGIAKDIIDSAVNILELQGTATIASGSTVNLAAEPARHIEITGTTAITAFGTADAGVEKVVRFTNVLTLTHNATSFILPSGANITTAAGDIATFVSAGSGNWRCTGYARASGAALVAPESSEAASDGLFYKADHESVAFTKTGAGTAEIKAGTKVEVNGAIVEFATATAITMPTLAAGTDYAIWVNTDESIQATTDFDTPPAANARKIGGFHYAPGGNATGFNAGGDTTPAINAYSFWDLKWRPTCPDPRGMVLVAGGFWCDIYLLGVNHHTDGTSAYNVTIADGSSPPKVPTAFGGNGSTDYGGFTSFEAREVMASHGKQLLSYDEFMAAAYGTDEAAAGGTDPVSTILRSAYTSIWGVMLATGNMWIWGRDLGGPDSGASWNTSTEGRGSYYSQPNAALFGGAWDPGSYAGSRASNWSGAPSVSTAGIGARGRSDHLFHV